ncbi:MAG: biliverdin-producing heme oxygenase [Methylophagaceae bacterium]|jgi:heme oxygenase|tara:strand:+ start:492 stop:1112 length:621 start_codon:yes stop_codon:yes gene_type:complete
MSNNLKALTKEHHDNAERTEFADMLLGGNIPPRLYQQYLRAQLANYSALESVVEVPMELEPIFRSTQIEEDLVELEATYDLEEIEEPLRSVVQYEKHVNVLAEKNNTDGLLAHLYVRHFGDAHGGQIIKRNIPGSGQMYEFEDRRGLIAGVRELLHDGMEVEAKNCFEFAESMFQELMELYHEHPEDYDSSDTILAEAMPNDNYDS